MSNSTESDDSVPSFKPIRLQRYLAQCGLGSRRECEELITTGRVDVDGDVVTQLGTTVDPREQSVRLDGERLRMERKKYFLFNKPSGVLCTAKDPEGRPVVLDFFADEGSRLFTVGRLDENTTGLLVVTNDGDLAQKLAHPRFRIFRYYRAQVAGTPAPEVLSQLQEGMYFTEGRFRVHAVKVLKKQKGSTWVEITMTEGQNREIRRLFARAGHKIMKLERIGYGPLRLSRLKPGEYRDLRRDELAELHQLLERTRKLSRLEAGIPGRDRPRPAGKRPGKPDPALHAPKAPGRDSKGPNRAPKGAGQAPKKKKPSSAFRSGRPAKRRAKPRRGAARHSKGRR